MRAITEMNHSKLAGHIISFCVNLADILDAEAVESCSLLFGTALPFYSDLASQKAVERVLEKALLKESFLKAFATSLLRIDGSHRSRQECFVLHKWTSLALQALRLPTGLKAAQKLMERQVISWTVPALIAYQRYNLYGTTQTL